MQPTVQLFIEDAGNLTTSLGLGRAIGQVFAYLYFNSRPQSLSDMQQALGISKGSASMTVRQLEQWEAVRKVWVKGDRKDYYEANEWIGQIVRNVVSDTIGRRLAASNGLLDVDVGDLSSLPDDDVDFVRGRIANLERFQLRARKVWSNPVVRRLLQ